MRKISDIYTAFLNGDKFSNEEAIALRDQFKLTVCACLPLGDRFRLAFIEANMNYLRLNDICRARGIE
jgi:hypothetical protein